MIMVLEGWNLARLAAVRIVNTTVLIWWRYLEYLRRRTIFIERHHLIEYRSVVDHFEQIILQLSYNISFLVPGEYQPK